MTRIRQDDLVQSIADALQHISYFHPVDFITNMARAYEMEQAPAAKDAIAQVLINSRMAAEGHRPMCQDTGIITIFLYIGMELLWDQATTSIDDMVNAGVRRAYTNPDNPLRESIVSDPLGARTNTHDNTPAVIHHKLVPGNTLRVHVFAKGGGGEAKAHFAVLNPSGSVVEWVLRTVPSMGAGWCPPGMLGIGVGGTPEEGDGARQGSAHGAARHARPATARCQQSHRGVAAGIAREGQCARDWCAGTWRSDVRPRRQDPRLPYARGTAADCHYSELRGDPSYRVYARWLGTGGICGTGSRCLAETVA